MRDKEKLFEAFTGGADAMFQTEIAPRITVREKFEEWHKVFVNTDTNMKEIEKYEMINSAESIDELQTAIIAIADENGMIKGRSRFWDAKKQAENVPNVVKKYGVANLLTRSYGIRQQALYLKFYNK